MGVLDKFLNAMKLNDDDGFDDDDFLDDEIDDYEEERPKSACLRSWRMKTTTMITAMKRCRTAGVSHSRNSSQSQGRSRARPNSRQAARYLPCVPAKQAAAAWRSV